MVQKYDAKNHVQSVHQKIKEECSICGILLSKGLRDTTHQTDAIAIEIENDAKGLDLTIER